MIIEDKNDVIAIYQKRSGNLISLNNISLLFLAQLAVKKKLANCLASFFYCSVFKRQLIT